MKGMYSMVKENFKRGMLCTVLGSLSWGISGTCGQYLFSNYHIDAIFLTNCRLLGAGAILLLFALSSQRKQLFDLLQTRQNWFRLFLFAVCGLLLCQITYLSAIQYSNSGTATILQTLNVIMMAFLSCFHFRRLPTLRENISVVLALIGVFLIATGGTPSHMLLSPQGLFWGIGAAIGSVIYTILPNRLIVKWGTIPVNGCAMLIGGILLSSVSHPWTASVSLDIYGIVAIIFIVLIGTVASFTLFLRGVGDIGPVKATFIGTLEPVSAAFSSFFWLNTPFRLADFFGFICILTTVYLITLRH